MGKQHFVDCLWRVPQWSLVLKTQKCWADLPMSRGQECGFRERCWITETNSSCTASVFGWIMQKSFKKFLIYETERPQRSLSSNVNKATLFMQTFTHFFLQHSTGSVLATKKKNGRPEECWVFYFKLKTTEQKSEHFHLSTNQLHWNRFYLYSNSNTCLKLTWKKN